MSDIQKKATIYLSYQHRDVAMAKELSEKLNASGYGVVSDLELRAGQSWRQKLESFLRDADAIVVLLTPQSVESAWVISEMASARAYTIENPRKVLIPVIIGGVLPPDFISDVYYLSFPEFSAEAIADRIRSELDKFFGQVAAQTEKKEERVAQVKQGADAFIGPAIEQLEKREASAKHSGVFWYVTGFICLLAGVGLSLYYVFFTEDIKNAASISVAQAIYFGARGLLVAGLLVASAKYCFDLGKSFMQESLKNANRVHAISYGKFYLQAFASEASWPELKELLQTWNIDTSSAFSGLKSSDFDPKFLENVVEVIKALQPHGSSKKE